MRATLLSIRSVDGTRICRSNRSGTLAGSGSPPPPAALTAADAQPDASSVEGDGPVDRVERVRQRQVTDAASRDRGAAGKERLIDRSVHRRRQLRVPRTPHAAREEPLQDPEIRFAGRLQGDAPFLKIHASRDTEPGAVSDNTQLADLDLIVIQRQTNRTGVLDCVVE